MINQLFRFCFEKRMLFIVVTILVVCFGYYSWTQLAIEAYPELSDVTAQVTTQVPGLAAEEIEQQTPRVWSACVRAARSGCR